MLVNVSQRLTKCQLRVVHDHPDARLELELHQILIQRADNDVRNLLNTNNMAGLI